MNSPKDPRNGQDHQDPGRPSSERRRDFADFLAGTQPPQSDPILFDPEEEPGISSQNDAEQYDSKNATPSERTAPAVPSGMPEDSNRDKKSTEQTDERERELAQQTVEVHGGKPSPEDGSLAKSNDHEDDGVQPEVRDRAEVLGTSVRWFAGWCLRLLIMTIAGYVVAMAFGKLWAGILPVILALIVCTVLWPVVRFLRAKLHFPNALAVATTILGFFALIAGIFVLIIPPAVNQSRELARQANAALQQIQDWLQGPPVNLQESQFNDVFDQAMSWLQKQSGSIAAEVAAGASATVSAVMTMFIMLVLTFFFLKDGEKFLPMVRRVVGRNVGWHLTEALTRCWNTLGGFIRTQAIVSLVDAVFIGGGLVLMNVPLAGPLAVLTFFAGFIPIVGATVAGILSILVALVGVSFKVAIFTTILVLAVQQLESNILSPWLQAKAMDLHPVIILLSVTVGGAVFGIVGAFLAVPVAAMIAVILRYMGDLTDLATGEKSTKDIEFATTAGSLSGAQSQRKAERWLENRRNALAGSAGKRSFSSLLNPLRKSDK